MDLFLMGLAIVMAALNVGAGTVYFSLYLRRRWVTIPKRRWLATAGAAHLLLTLGSAQSVASGLRDAEDPWTWIYIVAWGASLFAAAKIMRP